MSEQHSEKTEQPTSRRIEKSREEGQIARSRELATVAVFMAVLVVGALSGKDMVLQSLEAFRELLKINPAILTLRANPMAIIMDRSMDAFAAVMPLFMGLAFFAVLFGVAQTRGNVGPQSGSDEVGEDRPVQGIQKHLPEYRNHRQHRYQRPENHRHWVDRLCGVHVSGPGGSLLELRIAHRRGVQPVLRPWGNPVLRHLGHDLHRCGGLRLPILPPEQTDDDDPIRKSRTKTRSRKAIRISRDASGPKCGKSV